MQRPRTKPDGCKVVSKSMKIGVVCHGSELPAWEMAMVQALITIPGVSVGIVRPGSEASASQAVPTACRWYETLDSRIFGMFDDPLAPSPLPPAWPYWATPQANAEVFDLLVLSSNAGELRERCLSWSRHGVLWHEAVDAQGNTLNPIGFHEVMRRQRSSAIAVRHQRPGWHTGRIVSWSRSSTDAISVRRNREQILWKAKALLPRLIADVVEDDWTTAPIVFPAVVFEPAPAAASVAATPLQLQPAGGPVSADVAVGISEDDRDYPSTGQLLWQLAGKLPDIFRFYYHAKLTREQWYLKFQLSDEISLDLDRFTTIAPPRDRIWADPHIFYRDGVWHVFIEEMLFAENKGFISVLQIDAQGRWSEPVKVLETDYHLSYPQVFEHRGEIYMLPESSANRTIELYRCVEFPHRWTLARVLLDDIEAVDSSLLHKDGKWWLFCSVKQHPAASENDELHIYHSDDLLDGQWCPHRRNPVISDVTRARPAGRIIEHQGRLLRPSQNCAGIYGFGLNLNEVVRLDESAYEERILDATTADQYPEMIATHTLARDGRLTVVDACRRINHLPF